MNPTYQQGVRQSHVAETETRLKRDVSDILFRAFGNRFSLLSLLGGKIFSENGGLQTVKPMIKKKSCKGRKIEWFEKEAGARSIQMNGDAGSWVFTIDTANHVRVGDVLYNSTDSDHKRCIVDTVTSTTSITCSEIGASGFANFKDDDVLFIIGNAQSEGSTPGTLITQQADNVYNYLQIFRKDYGVSGTAMAVDEYAGKDMDNERTEKWFELLQEVERAFFFGVRDINGAGTATEKRFMGGIQSVVTTNVLGNAEIGTTLSETEFLETICKTAFANNYKGEKWAFGGGVYANCFSRWGRDKLQIQQNKEVSSLYGINVTDIQSPHGMIHYVKNSTIEEIRPDMLFIMELPLLTYKYLEGRDFTQNVLSDDGGDYKKEYILGEISLELKAEKYHTIVEDITGPAA